MDDTRQERFTAAVVAAIEAVERETNDPWLYVQSVVIAESGAPVARIRWNAETQGYDITEPVEADGR